MADAAAASNVLNQRQLYRLPWSLADNAVGWLEITTQCNITCKGCYRENTNTHKTFKEIVADLDTLARLRTFDAVHIAGGEPLLHPEIVDIVKLVTRRGFKSKIFTNGILLTEELLRDLRRAGLCALTIHVDSKQKRPHWLGKTETELCELRASLASLVAKVGGVTCHFDCTLYEDTIAEVPELVAWAHRNIAIANGMNFFMYRTANSNQFDFYAAGKKVDTAASVYEPPAAAGRFDLTIPEVVARLRETHEHLQPCAYLNGTQDPTSVKWLIMGRLGTAKKMYGHVGPRFMEIVQAGHHLLHGRYVATARPSRLGIWSWLSWMWLFDRETRAALMRKILHPASWFRRLRFQTLIFVQPIDALPDGRANMCDGCPDVTVFQGRLVWSCRLDECFKYGTIVDLVPKP